ncbi:ectonucleoside triphosphate diphosphohydrolase 2 [Pseudochaenichthys georgianus]|uniref:ectonucleoside triphosphate diphosphohydrolase 2 n=1 Tax=Pseudochaenichthys georgianus TaxID=52239 RepID=UPI00146B37AD|nr:ectonucleoside triphosphate diphosphohydrolase 2 [Pseudochaenichthys georgianus]XP_033951205.1 ectonucleoside triphosphate diphosphohydrolase 2 [Pseudochaenichthys georgianus]XP_033951206.1 ectonucleoside triphosphate diphosphohydrolase 2 [Pseudochaenichthys georgianus]
MAHRSAHPAVPIALLVFGLVAILLLTIPTEDVQEPPGFMYGIVLDAGSSHTALYIYKWPADKLNGTGVVTQHTECHVRGEGISSYAGRQGAAGRSLEACLDQAVEDIPEERHPCTPVYLGATAGMRLLQISKPELSDQILQEVGHKIQSYPFSYQGATILSGKEEGAYGWVTVNYLSENFIKYGFVGSWLSAGRPTVGALDLGGASTQITFETKDKVEDEKDLKKLHLYGHDYSLYTHSFLCYGRDEFLKRLMAHILKSQGYPLSITHPCYPAGFNRTVKLNSTFSSPCTEQYNPSSYDPLASVTVTGSGQYEHCLGNVSEIFSFDSCPFSQCSFDKVFQPNVSGSFMAFSAFYYVHLSLQRTTGVTAQTPSQLENAAETQCGMTFNQLLLLDPKQRSRLQDNCASSVFVKTLMFRGYGFDEMSFPRVTFQKKAGDTSVGWALGYMLSLSSLLPAETVGLRKALTPGAWATLIFLSVLLLVGVLVFILLHSVNGKKKGGSDGTI